MASKNEMPKIEIAVTLERAERGWVAFAPEARATAQGGTEREALDNLISLFEKHPDMLDELKTAQKVSSRRVQLVML